MQLRRRRLRTRRTKGSVRARLAVGRTRRQRLFGLHDRLNWGCNLSQQDLRMFFERGSTTGKICRVRFHTGRCQSLSGGQESESRQAGRRRIGPVVGGGIIDPYQCYCIAGGGGRADDPGEGSCVCVIFGVGSDENGSKRCECAFGGMGLD